VRNFWHVRPARTIALVVSSLLGLSISVVAVWAGLRRLNQSSWPEPVGEWLAVLNRAALNSDLVLTIGACLCVLGAIVLLCALLPGRHKTTPLQASSPDNEQVLALRGLSDLVNAAAESTDGVASARVTATTNRIIVTARTPLRASSAVRKNVLERTNQLVSELPLSTKPAIRIRMQTEGD
jgi:hypothetical protein